MITKFKKHSTGPVDVFNSNGDLIISLSSECTIKNVPNDILSFFNGGLEVWRSTWVDMYDYDTNLSLGSSISQVVGELRNTYFFKSAVVSSVSADNVSTGTINQITTKDQVTAIGIHGLSEKTPLLSILDEIGIWDNVTNTNKKATLDTFKTVILSWLGTVMKYQGNWDASTNTPTLTNNDVAKASYIYRVNVAGTQFSINWKVGDWLVYNSSGVIEIADNSDVTRSDLGLATTDSPIFADTLLTGLGSFYGSTINSVKDGITNIASNLIPKLGSSVANAIPFFTGTDGRTLGQSANATLDASGNIVASSLKSAINTALGLQSTTYNAASGSQDIITISPTISQSGTAGYSCLKINSTESAVGSGQKILFDCQVNGLSRFSVLSNGSISAGVDLSVSNNLKTNNILSLGNDIGVLFCSRGYGSSSSVQNPATFQPTISQSGTAGYSGLKINNIITSEGSGQKLGLEIQRSSVFQACITSIGWFGSGVSSPIQRIHAHESTASTGCYLKTSNATTGNGAGVGVMFGIDTGLNGIINNQSNGYFSFLTNNTEFMRASSGGVLQVKNSNGVKYQQTIGTDTDGDWWVWADTSGIYTQKRVTGAWVTKQTIT